jgi:hypothetical protein
VYHPRDYALPAVPETGYGQPRDPGLPYRGREAEEIGWKDDGERSVAGITLLKPLKIADFFAVT